MSHPQLRIVGPVNFHELVRGVRGIYSPNDGEEIKNLHSFDWLSPFRIHLPGGTAEYRPRQIDGTNRQRRQRMLEMLTRINSNLLYGLAELKKKTENKPIEHAAYIVNTGELGGIKEGTRTGVAEAPYPRQGIAIGYIHTHPVDPSTFAPPSGGDYGFPFERLPVQLVIESGSGRVWGLFPVKMTALLGRMIALGLSWLSPSDPRSGIVYEVIDGDQLRLEDTLREQEELRKSRERILKRGKL